MAKTLHPQPVERHSNCPAYHLLPAICVVCCATALAQTGGITEPPIRIETSSGLRVSTPSQTDAGEPDSIRQRLDEVASSFTKNDAFMGCSPGGDGSRHTSR
jgi:hypothetical protein